MVENGNNVRSRMPDGVLVVIETMAKGFKYGLGDWRSVTVPTRAEIRAARYGDRGASEGNVRRGLPQHRFGDSAVRPTRVATPWSKV